MLLVLTYLNPQKLSKETKNMYKYFKKLHKDSPTSTMSPLATWIIHCPYNPGISAPFQEDQREGGSSYGMMPTHTPSESIKHWCARNTVNDISQCKY